MDSFWLNVIRVYEGSLAQSPAKLWFGCFAVGIALELAFGDRNIRPGFRGYFTNIAHSVVYVAAIFLFSPLVWYSIAIIRNGLGFEGLIDLRILDQSTVLGQAANAALFLLLLDFFQYWWHRAQHRFPFLWDQHLVHHSERTMNVTTAVRHHWTEFMFQAFAIGFPMMLLFKITPSETGVIAVAVGALQFYLHSGLRISMGRLWWVFSSPHLHRMHHSILPEHQDSNYAAYFPIWDVVFGTYLPPRKGEYPPTGVAGVELQTVLSLTMHTFAAWARRGRSVYGISFLNRTRRKLEQ